MTLWTSNVSGWPGSIPTSARMGMRRSPNALSCSCESHTSLTRTRPSARKHTWSSSPSGGKSPVSWRRRIVSSYWSVLVAPGGAKRIRTLMAVLHGPGGRRDPIGAWHGALGFMSCRERHVPCCRTGELGRESLGRGVAGRKGSRVHAPSDHVVEEIDGARQTHSFRDSPFTGYE